MTTSAHLLSLGIFFCLLSHCAFDDETNVTSVLCDFMQSCVLPCSFQTGPNVIVNWVRPGEPFVCRYNSGEDHGARHADYRGRTSVFVSEISKGNASMLLKDVRVQDEGQYFCWVSTTTRDGLMRTPIRVRVRASAVNVSLELKKTELVCISAGNYPRPTVTWTVSPGSAPNPKTIISPLETGLFFVLSSVSLSLNLTFPHNYSCNVSTEHSWRSATYRRNPDISLSDNMNVSCSEHTATVKRLVWKFNHSEIILTRSGSNLVYNESWRPFVDGLMDFNSLFLKNLTQDQLGLFSCEIFTESEMLIIATEVTATKTPAELWKILMVVAAVLIIILIVVILPSISKTSSKKTVRVQEETTAAEPASVDQLSPVEPEECVMHLENIKLTSTDSDVESDYNSLHTDTPRWSGKWDESSGYGCDISMTGSSNY